MKKLQGKGEKGETTKRTDIEEAGDSREEIKNEDNRYVIK